MSNKENYDKLDELVEEESKKPKGELYCPKCGSHRLYYFIGGKAGWIYVCKDCGYQSSIAIEDGAIATEIRKKWVKKKAREK